MKNMVKLAVVAAVALGVSACDSKTDNNLASSAGNVAEGVGDLAEDAANATVNAAEDVGNAVGNGVDAAGNSLEANNANDQNEAAANTTSTNNR
jgi:type IV secretory pathway TrbL component